MPRPPKSKSPAKTSGKSGRAKSGKRRFRPLRWLRLVVLAFFLSTVAAVLFFRFVPPPLTPLMAIRCSQRILAGEGPGLDKHWRRLDRISPRLAEAVIASEDQRFFDHHGFDFEAIGSAFTVNGRGKRKLGASTITQQTAKNLFLWPDRSWTRKGLEAYFTLLLEMLWSKRRILEVYLNIIETGDGAYGAEAAARRYFQVSAAQLTDGQAALLAAVLPNPRKWSPARPTGYLQRRQTWILRQMAHLGPLPDGLSRGGPKPAFAHPSAPAGAQDPSGLPTGTPDSGLPDPAPTEPDMPAAPVPAPEKIPPDPPSTVPSAPPFPEADPEAEGEAAAPVTPPREAPAP